MKSLVHIGFFLLAAYAGWDYYTYTTDPSSDLGLKRAELQAKAADAVAKEQKVQEAKEFFRTVEKKRDELRALSNELATMKSTLTESIDTPTFMKLVLTEAKRVGLSVTSLSPLSSQARTYYTEYPFELNFQGVYVQLIAFLDRLSQAERIVRVDDFTIKPRNTASRASKFTDLEGSIKIRSFVYRGTDEDTMASQGGSDKMKPAEAAPGAGGPT
jgi:Tfp pilus assembly protein PilO